jgi:UDP-glucose 4-epimerase
LYEVTKANNTVGARKSKQMQVLVAGGTGYIGSHTVVELLAAGYDVAIVDNFINSEPFILDNIRKVSGKNIPFTELDVTDKKAVFEYFEKEKNIGAIIHFAALKAVGESGQQPLRYYQNNLDTLFNLLAAAETFGVDKMLFSSSATVYGQPDKLPVTEESPVIAPESPYGNTKKMAEEIIRDVTKATTLKGICLRYFNPCGAHGSGLLGELPRGVPNNLVPYVTQTAAGIREKLSIFGDDYNTPDGTAIRDYIHVVDLAKAHVSALTRMAEGKQKSPFEIFNIGTGVGYSVLEVVKAFENVNNVKLNYAIAPRRQGDIETLYADTTLANNELGWKAEFGLNEMMASAWKWQQGLAKTTEKN